MRMLGDNMRGVGSIWDMSGKKLGDAGETMENFRKERDEIRGEHNVRGVGSIWGMSGKKLGDAGETMENDNVRGVGSIWGMSGKKLGDAGETMENFRKELDEMRGEHVKLNILCGLLDKDLVRVEKALDNLTGKMNIVEPQEQEDFNKLRLLESKIDKLELQVKSMYNKAM